MRARIGIGALKGALGLALFLSCSKDERGSGPPSAIADAAADSIRSEARAFYRDLAARDQPALLTHFWPAKIAARWEPPFQAHGSGPAVLTSSGMRGSGQAAAAERCAAGEAAVARWDLRIEGRWARAMVPRCADSDDELWFLDMNGSWKIVRLVLDHRP